MSTLKERLRIARERKGMTQLEVCKRLDGLNNRNLSRYETGATEPDTATLSALSKLYEVSSDWLLGLSVDYRPAGSSLSAPAILGDPDLFERVEGLTSASQEKLREYVDMLKTLDEVKDGNSVVDLKKRKG